MADRKNYLVTDLLPPGAMVAGIKAKPGDIVSLTESQAEFEILRGVILLQGATPPTPTPGLSLDYAIEVQTSTATRRVKLSDLAAFVLAQAPVAPVLALSKYSFALGTSQGAILAAITAPDDWTLAAETTFLGNVAVSGRNLVAAKALNSTAAGQARIRATSPDNLKSVTATFDLEIVGSAVGDTTAPTITSPVAYTVAENSPLTINLTASEPATFVKTGGPDASAFLIVGSTVTFAAKDFENPTDANSDNVYSATFTASDAAGNVTTFNLAVTVTNVVEGTLAVMSPTVGTVTNTAAASTVVLDLPALVEGESRSYLATSGPVFAFNTAGKLIRGVVAVTSSIAASGTIRQTRGGAIVDTGVTINVNVPDTTAPIVSTALNYNLPENQPLTINLVADESVTWAKVGGDDPGSFVLSGSTVTFTAKDFEVPLDTGTNNTYSANFTATDAAGNSTPFTLTVNVTNVLEGALPAMTPTTASVDNGAAATSVVLDFPALVEGESRAYVVTTGPAFTINGAGKLIRGIATFSAGTATGIVRQTRGGVDTDTTVTITLTNAAGDIDPLASIRTLDVEGDSIMAQHFSTTVSLNAIGILNALNAISGNRLSVGAAKNFAASGGTLAQCNADKATQTGTSTADAVALIAGTNDVAGNVTLDTLKADWTAYKNYVTQTLGKPLIDFTIPPRTLDSGVALSAAQLQVLKDFNAWKIAQRSVSGKVYVLDIYPTMCSPGTDSPNPAYFKNESGKLLHPNPEGAIAAAKAAWAQLLALGVKAKANPDPVTGNLFAFGDLTGSTGTLSTNATGVTAAGTKLSGSGGTAARAGSKTTDGKDDQRIAFAPPSGAGAAVSWILESLNDIVPVANNYAIGDKVYAWALVTINATDRSDGPFVQVTDKGTASVAYYGFNKAGSTTGFMPADAGKLLLLTPIFAVGAGHTGFSLQCRGQVEASATAGNVDITVHAMGVSKA